MTRVKRDRWKLTPAEHKRLDAFARRMERRVAKNIRVRRTWAWGF